MSTTPDNKTICDRCGEEVTPGGLDKALVVGDVDESGLVVNLHFCRENKCDHKLLSKANTTAWREADKPKTKGMP